MSQQINTSRPNKVKGIFRKSHGEQIVSKDTLLAETGCTRFGSDRKQEKNTGHSEKKTPAKQRDIFRLVKKNRRRQNSNPLPVDKQLVER